MDRYYNIKAMNYWYKIIIILNIKDMIQDILDSSFY